MVCAIGVDPIHEVREALVDGFIFRGFETLHIYQVNGERIIPIGDIIAAGRVRQIISGMETFLVCFLGGSVVH